MTDDLVQRLRAAFKTNRPLQAEAADEIDRLRALVSNFSDSIRRSHSQDEHLHVTIKDGTITAVPMRSAPTHLPWWVDAPGETP